jgi:hypothetical protein
MMVNANGIWPVKTWYGNLQVHSALLFIAACYAAHATKDAA